MSDGRNAYDKLLRLLADLQPGPISDDSQIMGLLTSCWSVFDGTIQESTTSDKLARAENVKWTPPVLSFTLERHGGTVQGSSRAALHYWEVDVEAKAAGIVRRGHRPLTLPDKAMDVKPVAAEIAAIMQSSRDDPRVKRYPDGRVRLLIADIIPDANAQQTTAGRRKRFRAALKNALGDDWTEIRTNSYRPIKRDL